MISELIILGAGASKAAGAAIQSEMFKEFFKIQKSKEYDRTFKYILDKFKEWFGIDENNYSNRNFPTFEELLGLIHISQDFFQNNNYEYEKIKASLISLINLVLKKTIESQDESERGEHHEKLIKRLIDQKKLYITGFISLNYDMLLESRITKITEDAYIEYGIDKINKEMNRYRLNMDKSNKIIVYKPHGSLNWNYCEKCGFFLVKKYKSASEMIENPESCYNCNNDLKPYVIAPSYFKSFHKDIQSNLFNIMLETFTKIKRIYFCGYSFSDADLHIKYILKEIDKKNQDLEIYVCNNYDGKKKCNKFKEWERYIRFFRDPLKVHYLDESFEEFCDKGIIENSEINLDGLKID